LFYGNKTDYHFVLMRLGEMYLNKAEAYLLKGNIQLAIENMNITRVKHGELPPSEAATEEMAWRDYKRERRVEMALENDIYWSYLRWGKYGGFANEGKAPGDVIIDLNKPVHKIQISKDRKRFFVGQIVRNGAWERTFTTKRYLLPIPQGQLDKRAASGIIDTQNTGW
jgi:starch-binding outer membrane protein, SusD/RagB family